jgi:tetratricopeptide (TPR) repeat protein
LQRINVFLEKARGLGRDRALAKLLFRTADLHLHRAEFDEAVRLGEEAVALCRELDDRPLLAWALYVLGDIYLALQELPAAEACLAESVEVCLEIGYEAVQDISLLLLSTILLRRGELERADTTVREGLALAERLSDPWAVAAGLSTLGEILLQQKRHAEARTHFERSLEASRRVGDKFIVGGALVNLAALAHLQERFEESDRYAEEALGIFQLVGDETQQPFPLRLMGYAAVQAGNLVRARVLLRASLEGHTGLQDRKGQLACLAGLAQCSLAEGDAERAALFCALADRYMQEESLRLHALDEIALEASRRQCLEQLGRSRFDALYAEGQSQSLEEALAALSAPS